MLEVSASKFNKKTLEAVWVFFILKRLPATFNMFCSLQFSSFKDKSSGINMSEFLWELKTKLRQQQESITQLSAAASALAVQRQTPPVEKVKRKHHLFCSNGTHNPECTGHTPAECHQLHPAKAIAYHQILINKANAALANNKALLSVNSGVADAIVLDSGASGHYLKRNKYFTTFLPIKSSVFGANGAAIPILGTGSAIIQATTGPIIIPEAFYAHNLPNSLIPQTHHICQGYTISPIQGGLGFQCHCSGDTLCTGNTSAHVLLVDLNKPKALSVSTHSQSHLDLHRAMGHPSLAYLQKAFPDLNILAVDCPVCDVSKMHCQPFSGLFPPSSKPPEMIHMDLCGPMTPPSRGGNLYFLKIVDGFSNYPFIFPITGKLDTFQTFCTFLSKAENSSGNKLISVVSDNGGEFVNKRFQAYFAARGVKHLTLAPYTPQQNPFAK
jgi:hypothetical protein